MKVLLLSVLLTVLLYCHGGLSMMGGRNAVKENKRYANLHWLVKKIRLDLLNKNLIQERKQFGFVLLGDDALLNSVRFFQPNPILISAKQNRDPKFYDNLLVALPFKSNNKSIHSETTLLQELYPRLYEAYTKKHNRSPEFILLYSNLMPCENCTPEIIHFKNNQSTQMPGVRWFVGYHVGNSTHVSYTNPQTTSQNVDLLKKNGIRVFNVDFAKKPTLFSEIEQRKREHLQ